MLYHLSESNYDVRGLESLSEKGRASGNIASFFEGGRLFPAAAELKIAKGEKGEGGRKEAFSDPGRGWKGQERRRGHLNSKHYPITQVEERGGEEKRGGGEMFLDAIERTFSGCRVSASEERRRRPLFLLTGKEKFRFQPRILALGKEGRREDGRTEIDISFSFRPPPPLTSFLKCQSEIAEGGKRKENLFLSFFGWLSTPRGKGKGEK